MIRFWKESLTHVATLLTTVGVFTSVGIFISSFFFLLVGVDAVVVCLRVSVIVVTFGLSGF